MWPPSEFGYVKNALELVEELDQEFDIELEQKFDTSISSSA